MKGKLMPEQYLFLPDGPDIIVISSMLHFLKDH